MMEETHIVENKTIWKDEWLEWICGFANAQGGILNVGTSDDGTPVGLADIKSLLEKLPNKIINKLGIVSDVNKCSLNGIDYIEIAVHPSNVAITLDGVIYYRSGATNQTLRGEALERFLLSKMGMHWDEMEIPNATIEKDIDREAVDYFLKKAIEEERLPKDSINDDTQTVLKNLHLISDDGKIRIAAIILFGTHPEKYVRSIDFRIGRFISDESDLLFQDIIQGDIIRMADRIMKVLRSKYLVSYIGYKGMKRTEPLEIPEAALREIIYNSLIHRLYTGTFVQMKVYNDRVSVWNEGTLPEGFPVEMLKNHYGNGSVLSGHVSHKGVPGVEISTGSLGHGLAIGTGMALGARMNGEDWRTWVVMGDGECDEGSVWEAALQAAQYGLDRLCAVIDYNHMQSLDTVEKTLRLEPFEQKWKDFGWNAESVDGHDTRALRASFERAQANAGSGKPSVVLAHTVKGKGVSFMENNILWHYRTPQGEEYEAARQELEAQRP